MVTIAATILVLAGATIIGKCTYELEHRAVPRETPDVTELIESVEYVELAELATAEGS